MSPLTTHSIPTPTILLNVKVTISPADIPEFFTHFRTCFDKVVAEDELVYFVVGQNPAVPGEIWWTEGWRCETGVQWLQEVQLKKEYYGPYLEKTERMFLKPREVEIMTPEDGYLVFKTPQKDS